MNRCDSIELIAYLEDEDANGAIAEHLRQCPACRAELVFYRRLVNGLLASREEKGGCCPQQEQTIEGALGECEADEKHLAACRSCQEVAALIGAVFAELAGQESVSCQPLPQNLAELAAARRKQWLSGRMRKVLSLQGIKDAKEQEAKIAGMFDAGDDALPKAAFPDDLTGNKDDGDEPGEK